MARTVTSQRKAINTAIAWAIGLLIFFPILWTILTSFKTEAQAINDPPLFLFFDWTLENYSVVQERSNYMRFLWNSVIIAGGSTHPGYHHRRSGGLVHGLRFRRSAPRTFYSGCSLPRCCPRSVFSIRSTF